MEFVNKYKSLNYDGRIKESYIKYIILHYTAMNNDIDAINFLMQKKNKVSSHFLVNKKGIVFNLVAEKNRAWHAGLSKWGNDDDINSYSIGIEIDNSGHLLDFEEYTDLQIKSLVKLLVHLSNKYNISEHNILGHSDIAPYRKIDPGGKFPWKILYKEKLISLPINLKDFDSIKIDKYLSNLKLNTQKDQILYILNKIGYDDSRAKLDNNEYIKLIKAYQMHFLNSNLTGKLDNKTIYCLKGHLNQILTL